jgi:hypothetical protein
MKGVRSSVLIFYMISHERPTPYGRQPHGTPPFNELPRRRVEEDTLQRGELRIEQKAFVLTLKENMHGRFLRVVEHNAEHHDLIMVPGSGLDDFYAAFVRMVETNIHFPPANNPSPFFKGGQS